MSFDTLLALFIFTLVAAITPGPNNFMLLASGVNFGFRRTVPHILGMLAGFLTLNVAVALGVGALLVAFPALHLALKVGGGLYLAYLAWKIATARKMTSSAEDGARPLSFLQAALFQWVNPKGWIAIVTAVGLYSQPDALTLSVVTVVLCFMLSGTIAAPTWAGFGTALRDYLDDPVRLKWFNVSMGALLLLTLIPMMR
jgi:threonine/homoserine/homoserine lactone efflux protein